jgi:hypothetical protein
LVLRALGGITADGSHERVNVGEVDPDQLGADAVRA